METWVCMYIVHIYMCTLAFFLNQTYRTLGTHAWVNIFCLSEIQTFESSSGLIIRALEVHCSFPQVSTGWVPYISGVRRGMYVLPMVIILPCPSSSLFSSKYIRTTVRVFSSAYGRVVSANVSPEGRFPVTGPVHTVSACTSQVYRACMYLCIRALQVIWMVLLTEECE